ncbi:MAG TPA: GspH/FimT family protein [Candidatus Dormibacteraeota bacterium]|nr:GspH/FimT family protein [Candidatus Dormibacteraeota bacterium]
MAEYEDGFRAFDAASIFGARPRVSSPRKQHGFSIVELLIVVLIILVITGISLPSLLRTRRLYQLNSAASDVANILQLTRYEALRRNTVVRCRMQAQGNTSILWIDVNNNSAVDPTERALLLPPDVQPLGAGVAPGPSSMSFPSAQLVASGSIALDARGTVSFGGTPVVYAIYLGNATRPGDGFRAVTLTPMGQTKIWSSTSGGTWHTQ